MSNEAPPIDYRALLVDEASDLRAKLGELGFGDEGGLSYDSNFADSSQVTAERGEAERLASQLREALGEVERALARLDNGNYGICEACKGPIAPARLEAKPAVVLCINCASKR